MLSKVEASLQFNHVLLRPEAKNFTEVASLVCRGENCSLYLILTYLETHNLIQTPLMFQDRCQARGGNASVISV